MKKGLSMLLIFIFICSGSSLNPFVHVDAATKKVTINTDILNIRKGPGLSYPILEKAKKGDTYPLLQTKEDWYEVQISSGKSGWVASWHVKVDSFQSNSLTGTINVDRLNVRSSPNLSSTIIEKLNTGDQVQILEETGEWIKVSSGNQVGWVSRQYVDTPKNNATVQSLKTPESKTQLYGKIKVSQLNVRNKPTLDGKIIASLNDGQVFEILSESNNWVNIKLGNHSNGWIAGWFVEKTSQGPNANNEDDFTKHDEIIILNDGTNFRSQPSIHSAILARGNSGDTYPIIERKNDWYKIQLANGSYAYVASWIVKSTLVTNSNKKVDTQKGIEGKIIIIDPGHGGRDSGTIGFLGTLEKNITLKTAKILYEKLLNAGANVLLTRKDDNYISLPSRVNISQMNQADAFISLHYDSNNDQSVTGHTSYYYHSIHKKLAQDINQEISSVTDINDRGVRFGDFHVLRENNQPAVLLELGYLSNPLQEAAINSRQYQELISTGIFNGLSEYFE
ncbi:SH3 domain-containing protein [Heyndrickxia sp. NPDC080065]|uniref:SH3 domain-containing protein n=1 Tax=Heyndrickxia sp. NPDC080065 TaxID=3390568 RepID=UPI003CFFDC15